MRDWGEILTRHQSAVIKVRTPMAMLMKFIYLASLLTKAYKIKKLGHHNSLNANYSRPYVIQTYWFCNRK